MLTLALFLLLILIILIFLFIFFGFFLYIFDAFLELPYVATKKGKVATILELANLKKNEMAVDLGSGDGRLLFATAQKGAFAIGYELNPLLVILTRIKARLFGYPSNEVRSLKRNSSRFTRTIKGRIKVYRSDLWKADISHADVIFVYARQGTMKRMEDFIFKFAKKGSRVVVNTDLTKPFPTKKPLKSQNGISLYKV